MTEFSGLQSGGKVIDDAFKKDSPPSVDSLFPDKKQVVLSVDGKKFQAKEVDIHAGPDVVAKLADMEKDHPNDNAFISSIRREVERKSSYGSSRMVFSEAGMVSLIETDIEDAETYFDEYVLSDLIRRYKLAQADKDYYAQKWPRLHKRCSIVSTDVRDTIEWILPSLIRIFWGGNEIVTINGMTEDDDPEVLKSLIHWQIQVKNNGFINFMQWFRDALETGLGTVKAWWIRDTQTKTEDYILGVDEFLQLPPEIVSDAKELPNGEYWVRIKNKRYKKNQPKFKNIPPGEYIFSPEVDDDGVPIFGAHRSLVSGSQLIEWEKRGIYQNVRKAMDSINVTKTSQSFSMVDEAIRPYRDDALLSRAGSVDPSRRLFPTYECFGMYDLDGDGIAEPILTTYLNGYLIRKPIENTYRRPPFFSITGYPKSYNQWGLAVGDVLEDMQNLKTVMIKQIVTLISSNNDRKCGIDSTQVQAIQDLAEDRAYFRMDLKGGKTVSDLLQFAPGSPMDPSTFNFMELIQGWIENKTGVTRYNQGLDASSLNKTAHGISQIMAASNQRLELIARIFAETGVVDLFRFFVELNQRYMDQPQAIRLTNKPLMVKPDDIKGEFDVQVSAGVGVGSQQSAVDNLFMLLERLYPKIAQFGLVTPENVYNLSEKLITEIGYKNTTDYLTQPVQMPGMVPGGVPGAPGIPGQPAPGGQPSPEMLSQFLQNMQGGQK